MNKAALSHVCFPCSVQPMSTWVGRSKSMIQLLKVLDSTATTGSMSEECHQEYMGDKGLQLYVNDVVAHHTWAW